MSTLEARSKLRDELPTSTARGPVAVVHLLASVFQNCRRRSGTVIETRFDGSQFWYAAPDSRWDPGMAS